MFSLGDNEIHGNVGCHIRICSDTCEEVSSPSCHSSVSGGRNTICSSEKYQSHCTEKVSIYC